MCVNVLPSTRRTKQPKKIWFQKQINITLGVWPSLTHFDFLIIMTHSNYNNQEKNTMHDHHPHYHVRWFEKIKKLPGINSYFSSRKINLFFPYHFTCKYIFFTLGSDVRLFERFRVEIKLNNVIIFFFKTYVSCKCVWCIKNRSNFEKTSKSTRTPATDAWQASLSIYYCLL